MMKRKEGVVDSNVKGVASLMKKHSITRIDGVGKITSPNELTVDKQKITTKNILIATGSEPFALPFLSFDEKKVLSSTGALSLEKVPETLLVIGAGIIGVELASVYRRLGSKVIIFEALDRICPTLDKEMSTALLKILKKQGIDFHLSAKVLEGDTNGKGVKLKVEEAGKTTDYTGDVVLVAVGRKPYTGGLGLETVGVNVNKRGQVVVDGNFRTNVPSILAIGDVIDGPMLAHKASEEGVVAVDRLAGIDSHIQYVFVPNVVYTYPEVASVGLTEEEAKELGLTVKVGRCLFKANPRARCTGDVEGFVKVLGDANTHKMLGVHIFGAHASELIAEGMVALEAGATLDDIADSPTAHPTMAEAVKEACLNALGREINF
jgi:dihydrolipoamide dehydrogenase